MNYIIKKQNWMATAVVAVLLIGGVVYFVSDPIKAIIDRKVKTGPNGLRKKFVNTPPNG